MHEQKCLCGSMEPWTIHQGTWEESHSPVHLVMGRQTLVQAKEPSGASELVLAPLGCSWGKLGECWLGHTPTAQGDFVKAQPSQGEIPALCQKILGKRERWTEVDDTADGDTATFEGSCEKMSAPLCQLKIVGWKTCRVGVSLGTNSISWGVLIAAGLVSDWKWSRYSWSSSVRNWAAVEKIIMQMMRSLGCVVSAKGTW